MTDREALILLLKEGFYISKDGRIRWGWNEYVSIDQAISEDLHDHLSKLMEE